jgi:Protein of unknown function (DUF3109)
MIMIDQTLVSDELFEKKFVCDLSACKGACCVAGDSGAPLSLEETDILQKEYKKIKPFMRKEGVAAVKEQGVFTIDTDFDYVTPLVNGAECAYVSFDENQIAKCAIEMAYKAGKTDFKKPISCHLYPIRITKLKDYDALNYHHWPICKPACKCGEKLDVKVYKFLKEPIIRAYGEEYFKQMEEVEKLENQS